MHAALESGVEAAKCILLADAQQHVRDAQMRTALAHAQNAPSESKAKSKL